MSLTNMKRKTQVIIYSILLIGLFSLGMYLICKRGGSWLLFMIGIFCGQLFLRFSRLIKKNTMKDQLLVLFFLITGLAAQGQVAHDPKWDNVTIYGYGDSLTTCECNFENLFRNWSKWVTNHQETELTSFEYVETLKDSSLIEHYAVLLNNWNILGRRISGSYGEKGNADTTIYTRELYFYGEPMENIPEKIKEDPFKEALYRSERESKFKEMKESFRQTVQIGDKVYLIKLKIGGKKYDHHVICRPGENKIVFDNLFLGIHETRDRIDKFN